MARPRSFDENAVLGAAMLLFWKQGYEATSIRQLEAATGLSAPSLYGAFGDKEGLFTAALRRYVEVVVRPHVDAGAGHGTHGVRRMFTTILERTGDRPPGCLLAVTSSEAGALDAPAHEVLAHGLDLIRRAVRNELRDAAAAGELAADVDVAATADAIVALYEGIQVLRRSSPDHVDVRAIAGPVLDRLLPRP